MRGTQGSVCAAHMGAQQALPRAVCSLVSSTEDCIARGARQRRALQGFAASQMRQSAQRRSVAVRQAVRCHIPGPHACNMMSSTVKTPPALTLQANSFNKRTRLAAHKPGLCTCCCTCGMIVKRTTSLSKRFGLLSRSYSRRHALMEF